MEFVSIFFIVKIIEYLASLITCHYFQILTHQQNLLYQQLLQIDKRATNTYKGQLSFLITLLLV